MLCISRTATEQTQRLERADSRTVLENLRADTASLQPDQRELSDAASMLSVDPSVNLEVDSIILKHPAYEKAYGRVCTCQAAAMRTLSFFPHSTTMADWVYTFVSLSFHYAVGPVLAAGTDANLP